MTAFFRFAHDCYYILKAPTGSKSRLAANLILPGSNKMGFQIESFDAKTLHFLYSEIFARQHYYFRSDAESPFIFDCGANLGMATLYFKWLYPHSRIQAIEPDPATFRLLERNVSANRLENVVTHNVALWDKEEDIDFFIGAEAGTLTMSTEPSREANRIGIKVPARRLSDLIHEPVDFLKLDVEGAEHRVLSDLAATGKVSLCKQMVIEYHHHIPGQESRLAGFLKLLEQSGFRYWLHASFYPVAARRVYQDILIVAWRH
jgi:FkbM family methyltransferase